MEIVPSHIVQLGEALLFRPFQVHSTQPLSSALASGRLKPDTELLVLDLSGTGLALIKLQMAFHHVAQGLSHATPWMVWY